MWLSRTRIGALVLTGTFLTTSASQTSRPDEPVKSAMLLPAAAELRMARGTPAESFHPGRVLVRFKSHTPWAGRQAAHVAAQAKGVLWDYHVVEGLQLVEVSEDALATALAAYRRHPDVFYAEPDGVLCTCEIPNDPDFDQLWGLHNTGQIVNGDPGTAGADIRAPLAWDFWDGDPEFRIAVIDSGVNYAHPDLQGNVWTNPGEIPDNDIDDDGNGYVDDVHGYDFLSDDGDPMDYRYHGSHVGGTIAAVANNEEGIVGVIPQCKIVALRFVNEYG